MKKIIFSLPVIFLVFILGVLGWSKFQSSKTGPDVQYLIPEGKEGCFAVIYKVEGAEPLEIEDNTITHSFSVDGLSETSSPHNFGWERENTSGYIKVDYFYVDGEEKVKIPPENIYMETSPSGAKVNEEGERVVYENLSTFYIGENEPSKKIDCTKVALEKTTK
ncbi:hypothetical protein N780_15355 [Pontibacillus chungwhensis BH030062]|uniref:DUF6843 domain-containing protein n=1 Tax=Pontibacillus chungwhensis BH030062 TaxID=1385513 RepID=A0A0A2UZK3_9BACI|nr:hypothetical protein [Pontibacillus chungwhensis]KGP91981.1 hypothetical protein N780_15355 [Pontibacillus chungwhensis BH030062]